MTQEYKWGNKTCEVRTIVNKIQEVEKAKEPSARKRNLQSPGRLVRGQHEQANLPTNEDHDSQGTNDDFIVTFPPKGEVKTLCPKDMSNLIMGLKSDKVLLNDFFTEFKLGSQ